MGLSKPLAAKLLQDAARGACLGYLDAISCGVTGGPKWPEWVGMDSLQKAAWMAACLPLLESMLDQTRDFKKSTDPKVREKWAHFEKMVREAKAVVRTQLAPHRKARRALDREAAKGMAADMYGGADD